MSDATTAAPAPGPASPTNNITASGKWFFLLGAAGLIAFAVLGFILSSSGAVKIAEVFQSYLVGFVFWTCVGFGSLFFLLIQYVTGGRWGVLLRRPFEANSKTLVLLGAVLFVPIGINMFMGEKSIYWWAGGGEHHHDDKKDEKEVKEKKATEKLEKTPYVRQEVVAINLYHDEEAKKADYLNVKFSIARSIGYFVIFGLLVFWMNAKAMKAEYNTDEKVASAARNSQKYVGSTGLFIFAIMLTFVATDWVMSLEKTFNSTMFPVIYFQNSALSAWIFGLLTLLWLKRTGHEKFKSYFTSGEQIHLGSLLLAFTLFWAYTNFSQYMLTWIGNLSEEIPYYINRKENGWFYVAVFLILFHFFTPFLLLVFRAVKSNPVTLRNIALGLLVVCFVHVQWWISPSTHTHHHEGYMHLALNVCAWIGIGGLWVWFFMLQLNKHPLLPTREVYILEAYHHEH